AAPGPAAEALGRSGPGPFQVLYRTSSMGAAARWMVDHGVPPPARGVRNTGEQAMLVPPEQACGVYIGFVGPEESPSRASSCSPGLVSTYPERSAEIGENLHGLGTARPHLLDVDGLRAKALCLAAANLPQPRQRHAICRGAPGSDTFRAPGAGRTPALANISMERLVLKTAVVPSPRHFNDPPHSGSVTITGQASNLAAILREQEGSILGEWQGELARATRNTTDPGEAHSQARTFVRLLTDAVHKDPGADIELGIWEPVREFLAGISASRARQGA